MKDDDQETLLFVALVVGVPLLMLVLYVVGNLLTDPKYLNWL